MSSEQITELRMSPDQRGHVLQKQADYHKRIQARDMRYSPPDYRAARIPEIMALEIVSALLASADGIIVPDMLFRELEDRHLFAWQEPDGSRRAVEFFENYVCVWYAYLTGDMEEVESGTGFGDTFQHSQGK